MTDDTRDRAARALLQLIGKGPGDCFPFPEAAYRHALAVVDALTDRPIDRPIIGTEREQTMNLTQLLLEHCYYPVNHSSIGSEDHCYCGFRPRDWFEWAYHIQVVAEGIEAVSQRGLIGKGANDGP